MSLTGHLTDPESPVRAFFDATFPNIAAVRFADTSDPVSTFVSGGQTRTMATVNRFTPGPLLLPAPADVTGNDARRYDRGLAGAAFDYRLRLLLAHQDPNRFVAATGARTLARRHRHTTPHVGAWVELVETLRKAQAAAPTGGPAPGVALGEPDDLSRLCGLLALYEQLYRAPPAYLNDHPLVLAGARATLGDHVGLVDARLADDVAAMTGLFIDTQLELVDACAVGRDFVASNPTFDRSDDLGGADADLVVDGTLLELKAVTTAVLSKPTVWQVLGYLLADTTNRHSIHTVGWYFARHGYLWRLPAAEFLTRLHGGPVNLASARAEFASVLASAPFGDEPVKDVGVSGRIERVVSFFPNASGRGRWHIGRDQFPHGSGPGDPTRPVCGTRSRLDVQATPARPDVGDRWDADPRLCGSCLQFTRAGWGELTAPPV